MYASPTIPTSQNRSWRDLITPLKPITAAICFAAIFSGCTGEQRADLAAERPQEPQGALPYRSQEVRFKNPRAGIELAGTLTLPPGEGVYPAVVLMTGSGPQDRDETVAGHKPFLVLADHLTRQGMAVLRYDDRGVGASTGEFGTATMLDFVSDAQAAVEFLQARRDIDGSRIGLAGHSEGGMVVTQVALELPDQIASLVLLATPGLNGEEIFYLQDATQQRVRGLDETTIARNRQRKEQLFAVLKAEPNLSSAADQLRAVRRAMSLTENEQTALAAGGVNLDEMINQQIRLLNNDATRFFLNYDPLPALSRMNMPILAVIGENDLQVPPEENLPLIEAALSSGVCPRYEVKKLSGLNHLFQTSQTGLPDEYGQIRETIAPAALVVISEWILEIL